MKNQTTSAIVGAVVAVSFVANAAVAQPAEVGNPRPAFKVLNLPVVVVELGVGGEKADRNMAAFRAGQAKIATCPELKGSVRKVGIVAWRREGGKPRGRHVWDDLRDEFKGGKVTIAVSNFPLNNRSEDRFIPARAPLNVWLEEMKIPPLE